MCLSVCGAQLGDWANDDCVYLLTTSVINLHMVSMVLVL